MDRETKRIFAWGLGLFVLALILRIWNGGP